MTAQAVSTEAPTYPAASLDRRFYAFAIDRLIAWPLSASAAFAAYRSTSPRTRSAAGIAVIVGAVLVVGVAFSVLLGLMRRLARQGAARPPGGPPRAGTPIGVLPALLRTADPRRLHAADVRARPGHPGLDRGDGPRPAAPRLARQASTSSIVVDVRPDLPRSRSSRRPGRAQIVNLTAMRLVPAQHAAPGRPRPPVASPRRPQLRPRTAGTPDPGPDARARPRGTARRLAGSAPAADRPAPAYQPPARRRGPVSGACAAPPAEPAERTKARETRAGPPRWRVTFDTGETFVVEGLALVGRRPEPRPGEPVHHLVPLQSGDMSLSKTHAQFQVVPDGALVVMDRGSTNGSILVRQGMSRGWPPASRPRSSTATGPVRRPADDGGPGVVTGSFLDLRGRASEHRVVHAPVAAARIPAAAAPRAASYGSPSSSADVPAGLGHQQRAGDVVPGVAAAVDDEVGVPSIRFG